MTYAQALGSGETATYVDAKGERQQGVVAAESSGLSQWTQLAGIYQKMYEDQVAANNSAAAEATAHTLQEIERQIETLNSQYKNSGKNLYREYREAERLLPQQLAARGYSGGLSETSHLKLAAGYQETLAENERSRLSDAAELYAAGANARYENQAKANEANAEALQEYYDNKAALQEKAYSQQIEQAGTLAAAGDFSGYKALGYSEEQIALLRAAWEAEDPERAMAVAARSGQYSAKEVAALSPAWAQWYLNALGYTVRVTGKWDSATEQAYRRAFGRKSGRLSYSGYAAASQKEEETGKKTPGVTLLPYSTNGLLL